MRKTITGPASRRSLGALAAACAALFLTQAPAHAGGDITNFKVKNCASERIFVCSFDKTDSWMKVPYDAKGIKPGDKKEFGCASLGRCKVIIGVSKRTSKRTLSEGMQAALSTAGGGGAVLSLGSLGLYVMVDVLIMEGTNAMAYAALGGGIASGVIAVGAGAAVAGIEIADGWSDGEVCNQVRKAVQKAGYKPKYFLKNGKTYTVDPQYAVDKQGRAYVNADGTAVFAYKAVQGNSCPAPLKAQLVPN